MTRMTDRRTAALASTALVTSLLAGCNGDTTDPTTSTTSSSTTTSTSGSTTSSSTTSTTASPTAQVPVKPKFPAAAKKQDGKGAVAFVEYYWAALNYAWSKPDDEILKNLGTDDCSVCDYMQETSEDLVRDGQRFTSQPIELQEARLVFASGGEGHVITQVVSPANTVVSKAGDVVLENPEASGARAILLSWQGGWKVHQIGQG